MAAGAAVKLDRASDVPLYRQIERILSDEMAHADGVVQRLTETELIARFQVSRHTIREALSLLSSAGLIDRRPRRGTFPRLRVPIEQPLYGVYSFVRSMRDLGLPLHTRVVSLQVVETKDGSSEQLGVSRVARVQRLHEVAGEPLVSETIWLPSERVPGIEGLDLSGSVYELLQQRFNLRITSARENIRPVVLNHRQSRMLSVDRGCPAFFVERLSFGASGPVEVRHSLIRGDRYLYSVQLRAAAADELPA
ncbi:MAG TPA: GntR family transcriptional regulator [Chloroflexota bacterium]|nr:GntR family transcriptional regulator [Chloroflexota bacterium]